MEISRPAKSLIRHRPSARTERFTSARMTKIFTRSSRTAESTLEICHAGGQITSSPAINSDGMIYFSSTDGNFYALNPGRLGKMAFAHRRRDGIVARARRQGRNLSRRWNPRKSGASAKTGRNWSDNRRAAMDRFARRSPRTDWIYFSGPWTGFGRVRTGRRNLQWQIFVGYRVSALAGHWRRMELFMWTSAGMLYAIAVTNSRRRWQKVPGRCFARTPAHGTRESPSTEISKPFASAKTRFKIVPEFHVVFVRFPAEKNFPSRR